MYVYEYALSRDALSLSPTPPAPLPGVLAKESRNTANKRRTSAASLFPQGSCLPWNVPRVAGVCVCVRARARVCVRVLHVYVCIREMRVCVCVCVCVHACLGAWKKLHNTKYHERMIPRQRRIPPPSTAPLSPARHIHTWKGYLKLHKAKINGTH